MKSTSAAVSAAAAPSNGSKSHALRFVLFGSVIAMTRDGVHVVKISGDAGLRAAQDIAVSLRQALNDHDKVTIRTDAITGADITTIQLLLAANKQAKDTGKSLALAAAPSGALRTLLIEVGCLDADGHPLTPDGDFWTQSARPAEGKPA
jgi:ABC-type transporter Mla MlaB component